MVRASAFGAFREVYCQLSFSDQSVGGVLAYQLELILLILRLVRHPFAPTAPALLRTEVQIVYPLAIMGCSNEILTTSFALTDDSTVFLCHAAKLVLNNAKVNLNNVTF